MVARVRTCNLARRRCYGGFLHALLSTKLNSDGGRMSYNVLQKQPFQDEDSSSPLILANYEISSTEIESGGNLQSE